MMMILIIIVDIIQHKTKILEYEDHPQLHKDISSSIIIIKIKIIITSIISIKPIFHKEWKNSERLNHTVQEIQYVCTKSYFQKCTVHG